MSRYMEAIYLGENGDGCKTGVGAEWETDDGTTEAFESARQYDMDIKKAMFLIDLHEDNGDIVDTIAISTKNFIKITGEPVFSEAEYIETDHKYWANARKLFKMDNKVINRECPLPFTP